jgi:hypothetical protein
MQGVEHGNLTLSCSGEGGDPPANVLWKVPESLSPYNSMQGVELGNLTLSCSGEGGDPPANVLWKVPESLTL